MRRQVLVLLTLACFSVFFAGCAKEKSFETGFGPSVGSLQSETSGDCLPKNVLGIYEATVALTADNYIEVDVEVTTPGSYTIVTDTVNGFSFKGQGYLTAPGIHTVKLTGSGTPGEKAISNFTVRYGATTCVIAVSVLPAGASGPAAFDLIGSPNACTDAMVDGVYGEGMELNNSHTVTLKVNVTTIGIYDITTTTTDGITFKGTGALIDLGPAIIILKGSGTPTTAGTFNIPIAGPSSCTFQVEVVGPADYTMDCNSIVVNGTYAVNTQLGTNNTLKITLNALTVGPYNITATTVDGITFSGSGNIGAPGLTDITLNGIGKPTTAGTKTITLTGINGATCSADIVVNGPPVINWSFKAGNTEYSGESYQTTLEVIAGKAMLDYTGRKESQLFTMTLVDVNGNIQNNEEYKSVASANNMAEFEFHDGSINFGASPSVNGANMTFKITSHNTTAKTFSGTFSGTAKDLSNNNVTITNGTFKGSY